MHYAHEYPNISELCSLTSYNSITKIETYYSQNYVGTLGSSLIAIIHTVYARDNYNSQTPVISLPKIESRDLLKQTKGHLNDINLSTLYI